MRPNRRRRLIAAGLASLLLGASVEAASSAQCKPYHTRAQFYVKTMGRCVLDPVTLSFQGEPADQARCLMRGMDRSRNLAPAMESLPAALAERVGTDSGLPSREVLSAFLSRQDLEWEFAAHLWQPISHANDNDPNAPPARYFVIHDTSTPNYGHRAFPDEVDNNPKINNLKNYNCSDGWGAAHVVVNRAGSVVVTHDFGIPWRATKFEQAANFSGALKGLFVHVELVQPRRYAPGRGRRNDAQSPDPPFTTAQYDRLALIYVVASVRAKHWLIPAYHASIDADIRNGHDDPLNFDPQSFADSLAKVMDTLHNPEETAPVASANPPREPPFSPVATTEPPAPPQPPAAPAEPPPAAAPIVTSESGSEPPPGTRLQASERDATLAAKPESENGSEHKSAAEHCRTHPVKGHGRRTCQTQVAAVERGKLTHEVRPPARGAAHQTTSPRRNVNNVHARQERGKSRPGRA